MFVYGLDISTGFDAGAIIEWISRQFDLGAVFSAQWFERISISTTRAHGPFWWPFLLGATLIAVAVYAVAGRQGERGRSVKGLFTYLFAWKALKRRSTMVDVQIFGFFFLFNKAVLNTAFLVLAMSIGMSIGERWVNIDQGSPAMVTTTEAIITVIMMVMAMDLTEYFVHRSFHKFPFLWAFHRVHHSADTLNPLTAHRFHPLEAVIEAFLMNLSAGVIVVIATVMFGGFDFWVIFGPNAVYGISRLTFTHLRHSHVWINFPKPLCYILSSPAQHQVHHSRALKHADKNFAEVFSLWDWMFGTFYQPKGRERLFFGLGPEQGIHRPRPHRHILDVLVEPVMWIKRHYRPKP